MAENLDAMLSPTNVIRGQIVPEANGKVTQPKNIITTVQAARAVYYKYRQEHVKRIRLYAQIEGLIAGNPPYNPTELLKQGLGHIANFNTLDARAIYERAALAYWNLLNEAEVLCKVRLKGAAPELREFEEIMARNWDYVIRQWPEFTVQVNTLTGQLVKFGISPCLWHDERDWRWRTIELPKFFISDQTQSDTSQLTAVCLESSFTAQYLMEVYEAFKDVPKEKSPWDCDELSKLLLYFANTYAKTSYEFIDFHDLQKRLQNGDLGYDALFYDSIKIVSLLYKEYDGKISHYMFHRYYDHGEFMFFADRQYSSMQEAMLIFTASPGEYTIHSNRGLGHKIFSAAQAMMQLDCSIVDAARWASTPLLKSPATGSKDFEAIRFYPGVPTNIGTAEFQQNTMGANIDQLVGASQYLLQKINFNTANSGDDPGTPDRDQGSKSPLQVRMQSFREFAVLKNNIAHFYNQFDRLFQNMFIRMLNSKKGDPGYEYVKEWKDRCIEEGVPAELFQTKSTNFSGLPNQFRSVKATRVAGDGSTLARIMGIQELMPIASSFGVKGMRVLNRELISAAYGPEYVESFMPSDAEADETAGGASLAGVENAVMQMGQSPVFSRDNEQRSHTVTHIALGMHVIQMIQQQQMTPVDADKVFATLVPHLQEHLAAIQQNKLQVQFFEQVRQPVEQIIKYATLNRKNAEAMMQAEIRRRQQAAQNQQQVMSEEELKNYQVQAEVKRADFKVASQVERAKEANQTRAEVAREAARLSAQNQKLKITLDAEAKKGKTAAEAVPTENPPAAMDTEELRTELAGMYGSTPGVADIEPNPIE